jgi:bacterioferritin-associated ferredoxin
VIVCHCRAISDRAIRKEIERGVACEDQLVEACGAGGHCGGCIPTLQRLLDQHRVTAALSSRTREPSPA